ncbi:MAG: acyl--CoA ligase [Bacteroidales bacterium]|nr:acyl--CoA ligase [Bacteroidales bacterium]
MDLHSLLDQQIKTKPDSVSLVYYGLSITYGRLGKMIDDAVSGLHNLGIKHGDIVSIALPTTPESIALVYALNRLGAIACLINVLYTAEQVTSIVNKTHSKMLFIMNFNVKATAKVASKMNIEHIVVMRGCEVFPKQVAFWYGFGEWFNGRKRAFLSDKRFKHWDDIINLASEDKVDCCEWHENEPQMIFQTSGTTGVPKGVLLTAENIENSTLATCEIMNDLKPNDAVLDLMPIFAYYGFCTSIHLPLSLGIKVVIVPIWKPRNFVKIINQHRPQHVFTAPSNWDTIYKKENQSYNLDFLKTITIAGDVVKPDYERDINEYLTQHNCNFSITKVYGMTETAGIITATLQNPVNRYELGYSGYSMANHEIRIINDEVCVCPSSKFHGYYENQQATEQLIREHDGKMWIHTGDVGHLTDTGELFVVGRSKRMIVRYDGLKVFPIEIEMAILEFPGVKECAAIGVVDTLHPQSSLPIAFVVLNKNTWSNRKKVYQYSKKHLPEYMQPNKIIFVKELPKNIMGKTEYSKLKQLCE